MKVYAHNSEFAGKGHYFVTTEDGLDSMLVDESSRSLWRVFAPGLQAVQSWLIDWNSVARKYWSFDYNLCEFRVNSECIDGIVTWYTLADIAVYKGYLLFKLELTIYECHHIIAGAVTVSGDFIGAYSDTLDCKPSPQMANLILQMPELDWRL